MVIEVNSELYTPELDIGGTTEATFTVARDANIIGHLTVMVEALKAETFSMRIIAKGFKEMSEYLEVEE